MAYTEVYCDAALGSNLNGGAPIGGVYPITFASGTWVEATRVFTVAAGNPITAGVQVGDYASVYADGAAAPTGFVGQVTARDATTVTISLTISAGTAPIDGVNNRTIKIGGAWKGPNGTDIFPAAFVTPALTAVGTSCPRVNFKAGTSYLPTVTINETIVGPMIWQGYSSTVGDGGKATFDFASNSVVYINCAGACTGWLYADMWLTGSAGIGVNSGFVTTRAAITTYRVIISGARGNGFYIDQMGCALIECEAFGNGAGDASYAGFNSTIEGTFIRCISHDNLGSTTNGIKIVGNSGTVVDCICDTNPASGIDLGCYGNVIVGCDCYFNGGSGMKMPNGVPALAIIENCNMVKNGAYGFNGSGAGDRIGVMNNCAFGSGTQANSSGSTNGLKQIIEFGSIALPADETPWVDPANGDFRINHPSNEGSGAGSFTQTSLGYSGTVGYPDIGAAPHKEPTHTY